jgi:GAF domain-containing protein
VSTIAGVLEELRLTTGASRVTLRRDIPCETAFPVVEEALAPGVGSLRHEHTVHLPTQPVVLEIRQGRQVVQDDCASAYDDPAFLRMLETYGGLAAQVVTPIHVGGDLAGILSVHQLGTPRRWSAEDIAAATHAAERIGGLL